MLDVKKAVRYLGGRLLDLDGVKIGDIQEIYLSSDTRQPRWALVRTGLFGAKLHLVPIETGVDDRGDLRVPFAKDHVKEAPRVDADPHLSAEEERELCRHYGMDQARVTGTGVPLVALGLEPVPGATGTAAEFGAMGATPVAGTTEA